MMLLVRLALGIAAGLVLAGASFYCLYVAVQYQRPDFRQAAWLAVAAWWMGQILAGTILVTLLGALVGFVARAVWVAVS